MDEDSLTQSASSESEEWLRRAIQGRATEIRELLARSTDMWGYEDPIYRFYHHSFKVFRLQGRTGEIVQLLQDLAPDRPLNPWFLEILRQGSGRQFSPKDNARWMEITRP